jgi:AbrB family looped-hinge helix DNA binding protein
MQYTTTVSSKGQITLPAKIRRSLNLDSGDRITITKRGGKVTIAPDTYEEKLADLRKRTAEHLRLANIKPLSIEDMDRLIDESWTEADVKRFKEAR